MAKIKSPKCVGEWTEWVYPEMKAPYRMMCCDCGLVHNLQFRVDKIVKEYPDGWFDAEEVGDDSLRVVFRAQRNERSTGQVRRKGIMEHKVWQHEETGEIALAIDRPTKRYNQIKTDEYIESLQDELERLKDEYRRLNDIVWCVRMHIQADPPKTSDENGIIKSFTSIYDDLQREVESLKNKLEER